MSRQRKGKDWERQTPASTASSSWGGQLPHSADAEASILGGVLLRNDALGLLDTLEVEDFYDHKHKVVFQAIRNLEAGGKPIDVVTLENEIAKGGKIEAIGGVGFLGELTLRVPTVDNIVEYASIVRMKHITRQVLVMTGDVLTEAREDGREGEDLIHDLTAGLLSVTTGDERRVYSMAEMIAMEAAAIRADVEAIRAGHAVVAGVQTGIEYIDKRIGGHPRVPIVYMARPASGKTVIAMHLNAAAARAGVPSILASYEDGRTVFGQRGAAQVSHLVTERLRARTLDDRDLETLMAAVATHAEARTECVMPAAGMTVEALVRRVKRENLVRRHRGIRPFGQLLVDYLQVMPQPDHCRTRDEGIAHILSVLAAFSQQEQEKELGGIPVVAFSQLNREIEKRDDKRPRLSDARESGAIEQVAKLVFGIYRPWMYDPIKKKPDGTQMHLETDLHLLCLKNSQGAAMFDIKLFLDVNSHRVYESQIEHGGARMTDSKQHEQRSLGNDEVSRRFDDAADWHLRR